MNQPICTECALPATWERVTQFAGAHPYCEKHAWLEKDFKQNDDHCFWRMVASESRIQRRAAQLAAPINEACAEAVTRTTAAQTQAAAVKRETRVQQLAKYILLAEIERDGVAIPDMPAAIEGSFRAAELFDKACTDRMKKVTP